MQACPANPPFEPACEASSRKPRAWSRALSPRAMSIFSFAGAMLIAASSSAVTPLYRLYQVSMQLTPFWITVVFAVYVVSLLAALLTVGSLSDYVGRRPVILAALLLNAVAMIVFAGAGGVGELILARAIQGLAVGVGTTALGAAILDTNRARGPLLNSVTTFLGMTVGSLGAAALITFTSDPLHARLRDIAWRHGADGRAAICDARKRDAKAWRACLVAPAVQRSPQSRPVLVRLTPANIAGWALGGLYLSLMPTVVATAMGVASPWVGGVVVSAMMLTAAISVAAFRHWPGRRLISGGHQHLVAGRRGLDVRNLRIRGSRHCWRER